MKKKKRLNIVYLAFAKRSIFLLLKLCVDRTAVTIGIEEVNGSNDDASVAFFTIRCYSLYPCVLAFSFNRAYFKNILI